MADMNTGRIVEIKGVVLDAVFPNKLPEIYHALSVQVPVEEGGTRELIAEVQQHLGDDRVRAVAMETTDGLARGVEIVDTRRPISVPVGDQTLGRIWNVIGDPVDGKDAADGRALADPPRPAAVRRALPDGRGLRDRASRSSTSSRRSSAAARSASSAAPASARR